MSNFSTIQSWPTCALKDQRPLLKFWDSTFGSSPLEYSDALKFCEDYGFRHSVCDSPDSLRQCLELVGRLFSHDIVFDEVLDTCKGAVMRFLGFPEPKNFHSGSVVRKLALAFSSFEEVLEFNFSDSVVSSPIGKDVLRIFQATVGIPILDSRYPKAAHLGYLAHALQVVKGEIGTSGLAGCTMGGFAPLDVSDQNAGAKLPFGTFGGWTLCLSHEDSGFYGTASDGLLLTVALLSGCGDSGTDWAADMVVDFVRYVDLDGADVVRCGYLTSVFLCRLDTVDVLALLSLFAPLKEVADPQQALTILLSIGASGEVALIREEEPKDVTITSSTPTRSVLASALRRGLPGPLAGVFPLCRTCPAIDPATEEGWVERQAARADYRRWDLQSLRDWLGCRVAHSQVGASKHIVLGQINAWLAGTTTEGLRRLSPSEPEVPYSGIETHNTRQFSDDVGSRVFAISTLNKLSLYVIQAEMAALCPSFLCPATDKEAYVHAITEAFPLRAYGEAKRNSWPYLQRSRVPAFTKCAWPQGVRSTVLVALPFFDVADSGAEPVIAYYSLTQPYQGEDTVLLRVVNALPVVPSTIFMSKGDVVAVCEFVPFVGGLWSRSGTADVTGGGVPLSVPSTMLSVPVGVPTFSSPPQSVLFGALPGTSTVFPVGGLGGSHPVLPDRVDNSGVNFGCWPGNRPIPIGDATGMSGLTLVAREQPSRAKGDRTLKALMIADVFIRVVSVDPAKVLSMVMAEVFLSLVTHTGILTQLALVEVTQILQSVNFPSYALAIPLTMSSRHDITQALTTAKLFVGWRSEEAFPESRAARFDYRSNDPLLVYRVLWTIFRVRYGFFDFHTDIWDALVQYASRCEKVVRDLFHWTQEAVDFMIRKALRDLEMLDDRVGLTVPSALVAPSPDAVQACPILDRFAYRDAIDRLPDMRDPIAYYTHHQFVMRAQQLHSEGSAVRYVIPLTVVPPFKSGGGGGNHGVLRGAAGNPQSSTPLASTNVSRKDRSATFLKKRKIDVGPVAGSVAVTTTVGAPASAVASTIRRPAVAKNRPCHQWLSTLGCSRGTCRFDHAAPSTKSIWIFCRDEMLKLGLTAGVQLGVCPAL